MPPVLGPSSPSSRRLASCAGTRGTTVVPSVTANSDTSGPSRYSSTSTACPASRTACPWARAAARSPVTSTPLPAASPSSFTTHGAPPVSTATSSSAVSSSAGPPTGQDRAVGTPAAAITCLAKDLLPSSCAACAEGPKQAMPASRTASAAPATSGTSGPMTTSPAPQPDARAAIATGSATSTGEFSAIARVPALPGAQPTTDTAGSDDRATHRACSRAPEPITSTRTDGDPTHRSPAGPPPDGLVADGTEERLRLRPLLGPGARVDAEQLPPRLGLELPPAEEAGRIEPAVVDGGRDGAAGFAAVAAVAEPAAGGQLLDVGEGGRHAVGVVVERQLAHARGVDEQPAAGEHVQLAGRGGVPPAAVAVTDVLRPGHRPPGQRVRETGLPDAGRPHHRRRPPVAHQRADCVQPLAGECADRQDLDAERVLGHLLHGGRDVVAQVGLG